jgi:hypothetical protein
VSAPSEGKQREDGTHHRRGRRHSGGSDVSDGIGEFRWRATVAIGRSEMRRKNGWKTGERWSSPKGGNGGGVPAKSGEVGGAPVSRRGREVEGGEGEGAESSC